MCTPQDRFIKVFSLYQGLNPDIPYNVIDQINRYVLERGEHNHEIQPECINLMKRALRETNNIKYIEYVHYLCHVCLGCRLPVIDSTLQEQLINNHKVVSKIINKVRWPNNFSEIISTSLKSKVIEDVDVRSLAFADHVRKLCKQPAEVSTQMLKDYVSPSQKYILFRLAQLNGHLSPILISDMSDGKILMHNILWLEVCDSLGLKYIDT